MICKVSEDRNMRNYKFNCYSFKNLRDSRNNQTKEMKTLRREEIIFENRKQKSLNNCEINNKKYPELIKILQNINHPDALKAITCICNKICGNISSEDYIENRKNIICLICNVIKKSINVDIRYESELALINICCNGTNEDVKLAIENDALNLLVQMSVSASIKQREMAIVGITNIIGTSRDYRDMLLQTNFLDTICRTLKYITSIKYLENIGWCIANICRNSNNILSISIKNNLLNIMEYLLIKSNDLKTLNYILISIYFILTSNLEIIEIIIARGFIEILFDNLCKYNDPGYKAKIIRVFGIVGFGIPKYIQKIIDVGIFKMIPSLINDNDPKIRNEVLMMLTGLTSGTSVQKQYVFQYDLLSIIITHMKITNEYSNRREASWIIENLLSNSNTLMIQSIIEKDIVKILSELMLTFDYDLVLSALNSLESILIILSKSDSTEKYNILIKLEKMIKEHNMLQIIGKITIAINEECAVKASMVLENYYLLNMYENKINL